MSGAQGEEATKDVEA
jgi:ribonuclease HI